MFRIIIGRQKKSKFYNYNNYIGNDCHFAVNNNFIASNNPISDISALENITVGGNIELIDTPWANVHKNDIKNASIIVEKNIQETIFD